MTDPSVIDRVALPVTESDLSSIIDHMADVPGDPYSWLSYVWDVRQKFPHTGRDEIERWAFLVADEEDVDADADLADFIDDADYVDLIDEVNAAWAAADRPFDPRRDGLLIDLMRNQIELREWQPSPEIAAMIERAVAAAEDRLISDDEVRAADESLTRWTANQNQFIAHLENIHRMHERKVPMPVGHVPLLNTQAVVADLGRPIVGTFLAAQTGRIIADAPKLPDVINSHPLFESMNTAVAHIVGQAESAPKTFHAAAALDVLAVLSAVHESVFATVCTRVRAAGAVLPDAKLTAAVRRFEAQVAREVRTGAGWATDSKGMPDGANSDNVAVFMRTIGAELRFNAWSQRVEIRWSADGEWIPLQEKDFNALLTTAANGQHNFRPRETLFKRTLATLAYETTFDPVLDRLAAAQNAWDGTPRLDTWLSRAAALPDDAYHRAVARNLIGGMIKRARRPGCKHDEVVIFIGPQDTLKSTLCRVISMDDEWFTDSVDFSGSAQNTIPQLFGRLVVELAELDGMARREVQYIKRFLSAQSDNVTLKYEAFSSEHARRCIFIGTSNENSPLRDTTGNRRFLPVRVEQRIDIDFVRDNLEQIVGEAAALEAAGETFLIPRDVLADARAHQEAARAESDFEIHLTQWFGSDTGAAYILPADLAVLVKDAVGRSVPPNQYGAAMRSLGFLQMTVRIATKPTRVWLRGDMEIAQRYAAQRDTDGRMFPRRIATIPVPVPGITPPMPQRNSGNTNT